jgi:hypothetical protein
VDGQHHAPAALPQERDPVSIVQEAGLALGSILTGVENLAPTEIRSPDRPARNVVAIPATLSRPTKVFCGVVNIWRSRKAIFDFAGINYATEVMKYIHCSFMNIFILNVWSSEKFIKINCRSLRRF